MENAPKSPPIAARGASTCSGVILSGPSAMSDVEGMGEMAPGAARVSSWLEPGAFGLFCASSIFIASAKSPMDIESLTISAALGAALPNSPESFSAPLTAQLSTLKGAVTRSVIMLRFSNSSLRRRKGFPSHAGIPPGGRPNFLNNSTASGILFSPSTTGLAVEKSIFGVNGALTKLGGMYGLGGTFAMNSRPLQAKAIPAAGFAGARLMKAMIRGPSPTRSMPRPAQAPGGMS